MILASCSLDVTPFEVATSPRFDTLYDQPLSGPAILYRLDLSVLHPLLQQCVTPSSRLGSFVT